MADTQVATVTVKVPGGEGTFSANPKEFSTGSKGFYGASKVQGKGEDRYQVSVSIVLIGSKPDKKKAKK
jgi:hypothetical protein